MQIFVRKGDIVRICLDAAVDAVVNPANSFGYMGGGVAGILKKIGGAEIEKEAVAKGPIPIGKAIVTKGGALPFKIIHAPTMKKPAEKAKKKSIEEAMNAALRIADRSGFVRIAIPGMGTGVGGLAYDECAQIMKNAITNFKASKLKEIILVDVNDEMVSAWKMAFKL